MVHRMIARAQLKQGVPIEDGGLGDTVRGLVQSGKLMTGAAFRWQNHLFVYAECMDQPIEADALMPEAAELLEEWPGHANKRKWIPMIDVFHFNEPASREHWRRKEPVERRVGRVAHLKPEMAASYIYYHYQLQEEQAFHGPKYEIIAVHENLLFGYQEFPAVVEPPALPGKLNTSGTPSNWSDSRMDLHFQPWEDGHLYFKPIETVFAYYKDE